MELTGSAEFRLRAPHASMPEDTLTVLVNDGGSPFNAGIYQMVLDASEHSGDGAILSITVCDDLRTLGVSVGNLQFVPDPPLLYTLGLRKKINPLGIGLAGASHGRGTKMYMRHWPVSIQCVWQQGELPGLITFTITAIDLRPLTSTEENARSGLFSATYHFNPAGGWHRAETSTQSLINEANINNMLVYLGLAAQGQRGIWPTPEQGVQLRFLESTAWLTTVKITNFAEAGLCFVMRSLDPIPDTRVNLRTGNMIMSNQHVRERLQMMFYEPPKMEICLYVAHLPSLERQLVPLHPPALCDVCILACEPLYCGRCGKRTYCSKACQKYDWRVGHRDVCVPK
jgi:hypothetical protein